MSNPFNNPSTPSTFQLAGVDSFKPTEQAPMPSSPFGLPMPTAQGKNRPASHATGVEAFERRFLSERFRGGKAMIEVAILWNGDVQSVTSHRTDKSITVGPCDATYLVDHNALPAARPLIEHTEQGPELHVASWMTGFLVADDAEGRGKRVSFETATKRGLGHRTEDGYAFPLTAHLRARIDTGAQSILIHLVSAPALVVPLFTTVGLLTILLAVFGSLALHGVAGAMVAYSTDRAELLTLDQNSMNNAYGETLVTPKMEEEEEPDKADKRSPEGEMLSEDGSARAGEEGESGTPDSSNNGRLSIAGNESTMMPAAIDVARNSGALARSQEMEMLLASSMPKSGWDATDAWGKFDSDQAAGDARGTYGLGMTGTGRLGGGENPRGLYGTGEWGTVGKHNPDAEGGLSSTKVSLPDKPSKKPVLHVRRATISGSLDKRLIRKVVTQHKNEIKACYERELQKKKGLHGKIVVKWFIDRSGNVTQSFVTSSSMNNATVEGCVQKSVAHWRFPAPKDGGLVSVSYPFVFEVTK